MNSQNDIFLAVFLKENQKLVVSCSFQSFDTDTIEFGLDVMKSFRNQGFGIELADGMLKTMHTVFPGKKAKMKTNVTNLACRKVAENCGGVLTEYESTFASKIGASLMKMYSDDQTDDEELIKIKKKNAVFIEAGKEGVCVYYFK